MKYKHVKWWVSPLNRFLLQWFTLKLGVEVTKRADVENYGDSVIKGWQLDYGIVPLSGWSCYYRTFRFNSIQPGRAGVILGQQCIHKNGHKCHE